MESWLPVVWAVVLASGIGLYVLLDGFDLGVGILFPFARAESDRDLMMNAVAPFWDGNETWLILGGGGLLVAFPAAYSVLMPAFYLPLIVMLLALVFRGVAFEFRFAAKPDHRFWDVAFWLGSTVAAFCQGVILGAFIQGVEVVDGRFAGSGLDAVTPFSIACGIALVAGYALTGAGWLMARIDGELADRAARWAGSALLVVITAIALATAWTFVAMPRDAARWLSGPLSEVAWIAPACTAVLAAFVWRGTRAGSSLSVFLGSLGIFLTCFLGLALSLWPYVVPFELTIFEAAGAPESQAFMLVGVAILLPLIIGYTVFVYRAFWGKVREGEGYH